MLPTAILLFPGEPIYIQIVDIDTVKFRYAYLDIIVEMDMFEFVLQHYYPVWRVSKDAEYMPQDVAYHIMISTF